MGEVSKPDCYQCCYRRTIPGDAHSMCGHPEVGRTGLSENYIAALAEAYTGKAASAKKKLGVVGGGQTWPANFNPVFLTRCNGFKPKGSS